MGAMEISRRICKRNRLGWGKQVIWGPNIADQASGVFFGAFALARTTASIMSGLIERIQTVGFTILAIVLGLGVGCCSGMGWHGWLACQDWGVHDFGRSLHAVAGFFALGVLVNGARLANSTTTEAPIILQGIICRLP